MNQLFISDSTKKMDYLLPIPITAQKSQARNLIVNYKNKAD